MSYIQNANDPNLSALHYAEISGKMPVKIMRIETYTDQHGYIKPLLHIMPKVRIGNREISLIHLRAWDMITEANIYPGCTVMCEYTDKHCRITPPDFSIDAIKKSNAVVADIRCPICYHGQIVSNASVRRCTDPYCNRHIINAIWKFLRLGLRMGNLPYMSIYNLWRDYRIRHFDSIWELTDSDLAAIGITGYDIDNFRLRVANATEIRLDMLIYFLQIDGVKTNEAMHIARKIASSTNAEYIDSATLFDRINLKTKVMVENINGEMHPVEVKDTPVCLWRHYVLHNMKELSSILSKLKIVRPKKRYNCAGFNFVVGDTGGVGREDVMDLIILNEGNVIPLSQATNWSMISYFVTANPFGDDPFLLFAKSEKVNIISLEKFEELFGIPLPNTELTFSELYERQDQDSSRV